ncbi:MAG: 16S rRNA (cytosine(1402)-N(4))-methyltransferase RsmH [Candidatus Nealsonbacteria bacterium]|nr:16S rRNA (cytosine(1402)-N(4))-methyltransferase RsmH [Candidatus Nealsonbacteria bacterium]
MVHIPVLQKEVLQYLEPKPNENFIDCTIGKGGHALAILEKNGPNGKVLGIDQDQEIIQCLKTRAAAKGEEERLILVCDNFANLEEIVKKQNFKKISGILFDLGMSSWHLEESGRGFSFLRNEPLDMRYDLRNPLTAEKIINFWSEPDIEKILKEFGEENFSEKIAKTIIKERKFGSIKTTFQLVRIIKKAVPLRYQEQRLHCATRTFQAIRIAVNEELENLRKVLPQAVEILPAEGKLIVISFHSLEDRIVKNFFREKARENILKIITKKPVSPDLKEIKINTRSRSGKLRTAVKICLK